MTRNEIIEELHETQKDLLSLKRSRDVLHARLREQEGTARYEDYCRWPLMQVLINTYIAAIVRCEGLIEDYKALLQDMGTANVIKLKKVEDDGH